MARVTRMLLASFVLALPTILLAADPPAGSYKFVLPMEGQEPLWLLKLESKDGKWIGEATPAPKVPPTKIEGIKIDKGVLSFTMNVDMGQAGLVFEGRVPSGKAAKILGTVSMKGEVIPAILEPTTLPSLQPFDVNRELMDKSTNQLEVIAATLFCLGSAEEKKVKSAEAKVWAEKAVKSADEFGPKWKRLVLFQLAEVLGKQEGFTGLALEYAEQSEKLLDPATDNPRWQRSVLTVLADALEKAGKKEDAKKYRDRIDKLSSVVAKPFPGRKAKSDRVVLVELFTCAEEPNCVGPDLAFNALLGTYKPSEVVLLQYHLSKPEPDPLTNAETEARAKFYETARGTPKIFFNGGDAKLGGGPTAAGQAMYDRCTELLGELLEKPSKMKISATATKKGNKLEIKTDVADLQETGSDIRLRVALVEANVAYTGSNKETKFVQVVRHFPTGASGTAMTKKTASESYTVDLDMVRKNLNAYLDKSNDVKPFPNKSRPLELKNLRVVAFVQNDETGEVLNAVQVDVKE